MEIAPLVVFLCCCIFRIVNLFLVQSQFDPDEYWQGLEPAYCQVFGSCDGLTWEWKRRSQISNIQSVKDFIVHGLEGPVRSYVSIVPTMLFYYVVKYAGIDSTWMISRGPLFINAILVAAPTDWSVWYMAKWMSGEGREKDTRLWYLYASLTSWFNAYALVRTYSNSLETCFLAIGLCLVSPVRFMLACFFSCFSFLLHFHISPCRSFLETRTALRFSRHQSPFSWVVYAVLSDLPLSCATFQ
jgi:phosphatidylinositol glycan class B